MYVHTIKQYISTHDGCHVTVSMENLVFVMFVINNTHLSVPKFHIKALQSAAELSWLKSGMQWIIDHVFRFSVYHVPFSVSVCWEETHWKIQIYQFYWTAAGKLKAVLLTFSDICAILIVYIPENCPQFLALTWSVIQHLFSLRGLPLLVDDTHLFVLSRNMAFVGDLNPQHTGNSGWEVPSYSVHWVKTHWKYKFTNFIEAHMGLFKF